MRRGKRVVKVEKESIIPASLNSAKTSERRGELIYEGKYIYKNLYDSRYKMSDIKEALKRGSHKKCVYCEKSVNDENFPVEHYRPKSAYYWLAYSWDNLLLSCDKCNTKKSDSFEIAGSKASYREESLADIHTLGSAYDAEEIPSLVNPVKEDVEDKLTFTISGRIESTDSRCAYTIETCDLDRTTAQDNRKAIWNDLYNKITDRVQEIRNGNREAMIKLTGLIEDFAKDAENPDKEYLAFRRYILRERLIERELQKLLS